MEQADPAPDADYSFDSVMAPGVLGQRHACLLTAVRHLGKRLGPTPSTLVDVGIHTVTCLEL
ncbi:hypothetical protein [Streptomyces phaeochromogenes]|uniref:hypothetical protein n=1 Tax=Streptomyces phaeochromogenes TaxID=1923 RepID=UPI000A43D5D8|nr:hypothetical protein [Streptomyces phaeochromogenes]